MKVGGSAIASGGFGCVFSPSIKCKNKKTLKNKISKLMFKEHANSEINEVKRFSKTLKKISNYNDYFIIPENICEIDEITEQDKINFDNKCLMLKRNGINSINVNNNLGKLNIIQQINGGVDISVYFDNNTLNSKNLIKINNSLIKLLKNGILKINSKNIYHFDIKSANILIKNNIIRLIDWGLSEKITKNSMIRSRPMHYNMPYSNILFNTEYIEYINYFLETQNVFDFNLLVNYLQNIYNHVFIQRIGKHHDDLLDFILYTHLYPNDRSNNIIFDYIGKIVVHYSKNKKFDYNKYFHEVYIKNSDIWGFSTIYLLMIIDNLDNINLNIINKTELKNKIFHIFKKYIIGYSYKKIPVKMFMGELVSLNTTFKKNTSTNKIKLTTKTDSFNKNSYDHLLNSSNKDVNKNKINKIMNKTKKIMNKTKKVRLQ